jgi:hypothetical protein
MIKSPFKFLDAYTLEDREIFFGRDHEISELYRRVFESKILLIYGISGTGKSSLINCGLASRFDESDWLPVNVRRGNNITESLDKEINNQAISPLKPGQSFIEKIQSIYLDHFKPVYLIFDQFEELFIFGSKEERKYFIQIIKSIVESDLKCRILFVMREEYMAGVTEFENYIPAFFDNRLRIEKMSHTNALEAIKKPCKVFNISVEEGFAEDLLEKLSPGSTEIELTYLQVFLDKIFRLSLDESNAADDSGQPSFTLSLLGKVGNVSDLLGSFLEEQIAHLNDPETSMIVLKSFVSAKGTKRQLTPEEARDYAMALGKPIDYQVLLEMIQIFINLRILREKDQNGRFELRHDDLATKIYEKITLVEKEILEVRQFIENAWQNWQNREVYLSEDDLAYIAPYEDKLFLNRKLEQFISESRNIHARLRRRRRTILTAAIITLFAVLTFFTGWALNERRKAVEQSKLAENQRTEAISARDDAIKARNESNRMQQEALSAKDEALVQKSVADSALVVAENEKRISEMQRKRSEDLYIEANNQRQIAQESEKKAEQSAGEVRETNRRALYQLYLFNAKEFANKSLMIEKNDTLKALLALTAYDLVNRGFQNYSSKTDSLTYEIVILEALQKAYSKFEDDSLLPAEVWSFDSNKERIIFSDMPGRLLVTRLEDQNDGKLPALKIMESVSLKEKTFVRSLAADTSGSRIACGTIDGNVILVTFNNNGNYQVDELYKHKGSVLSLIFVPGKNWLVSSSTDKTIKIWDLTGSKLIAEVIRPETVKNTLLAGNSELIFTDDKGKIYSLDLGNPDSDPITLYRNDDPINAMAYNARRNWLVFASYGEIIALRSFSGAHGEITPELFPAGHTGLVSSLKFSPDNRWIGSSGLDGTVLLWDLNQGGKNDLEKMTPIIIENKNSKTLSLIFDDQSRYMIYGNSSNLQIFPVDQNVLYKKLRAKMGYRTIRRNEWEYYVRGDLKFESQTVK